MPVFKSLYLADWILIPEIYRGYIFNSPLNRASVYGEKACEFVKVLLCSAVCVSPDIGRLSFDVLGLTDYYVVSFGLIEVISRALFILNF